MDIVQRLRCVLKGVPDAQRAADEIIRLRADLAASRAECERVSSLYEELLFAVEYKHPSETRHQIVLWYIWQCQK